MHSTKPSLVPSALPANLRTRSTGTIHASITPGYPLCPARARAVDGNPYAETNEPITCGHCLKLAPIQMADVAEDTAPLSGDQLDGLACIRCGAVDAPMVPAGMGEHGQLFACTSHTVATEFGVRGTIRTAEGEQVKTYTGRDGTREEAAGLLGDLLGVQERQRIEADAVIVSRTSGGTWVPVAEEPEQISDRVLLLAMSLGMSLGLETVDEVGYADAERVMLQMARKELTQFDIAEMSRAFRGVLARRQASEQCDNRGCLMCEVTA
ncbi:hypothetical protein [Streptosporangium amethystogenes]|uniref:hypothetical protein n=1 Tax=Streptosporangium amethystogenes TaxID=2002 RepID=UPI0004C5F069|nr:hypothetical protein [Streptosporangium amethystogenes]